MFSGEPIITSDCLHFTVSVSSLRMLTIGRLTMLLETKAPSRHLMAARRVEEHANYDALTVTHPRCHQQGQQQSRGRESVLPETRRCPASDYISSGLSVVAEAIPPLESRNRSRIALRSFLESDEVGWPWCLRMCSMAMSGRDQHAIASR